MVLDLSAQKKVSEPLPLRLSWQSDLTNNHQASHLQFSAQPGRLVIPMDAHPRWLLSKRLDSVALEITKAQQLGAFRVSQIYFAGKRD
jgi:hypothetical protein